MLKNLRTETTLENEFKNKVIDVVGRRLGNLEKYKIIAKSTFLGPRLTKIAFGLQENADNAHKWVCDELTRMICNKNDKIEMMTTEITATTKPISNTNIFTRFITFRLLEAI
jgi:phenolic acid decarboxylase